MCFYTLPLGLKLTHMRKILTLAFMLATLPAFAQEVFQNGVTHPAHYNHDPDEQPALFWKNSDTTILLLKFQSDSVTELVLLDSAGSTSSFHATLTMQFDAQITKIISNDDGKMLLQASYPEVAFVIDGIGEYSTRKRINSDTWEFQNDGFSITVTPVEQNEFLVNISQGSGYIPLALELPRLFRAEFISDEQGISIGLTRFW